MSPLPFDERRIAKLAEACDSIDAETPRKPDWKRRNVAAYKALGVACDLAAANARAALSASPAPSGSTDADQP